MASISLTEFFPGDAFSATAINSAMSSWVTQSTNIDGSNVREEGITRRVLEDGAVAPSNMQDTTEAAGPITKASAGAATMLTDGATVVKVGAFSWNASIVERLVVRMSMQFEIDRDAAVGTGASQPTLYLDLRYGRFANDAAADASIPGDWTLITGSQRQHEFVSDPVATAGSGYNIQEKNNCAIAVRLDQLTTDADDYYVCIFFRLVDTGSAPNVQFDDIQMSIMGYVR